MIENDPRWTETDIEFVATDFFEGLLMIGHTLEQAVDEVKIIGEPLVGP